MLNKMKAPNQSNQRQTASITSCFKYLARSFSRDLSRNWLAFSAIAILSAPIILFIYSTEASSVISRDQWHHLTMLTKYFEGNLQFHDLLLKHGEHLMFGYNVWFVANGALFGLNTQIDAYIGAFFLITFTIILYQQFALSIDGLAGQFQKQIAFILLLTIALSFNQAMSFMYGLLGLGVFSNLFFMIVFLSCLDSLLLREKNSALNKVIIGLSFLFLLLLFAGGAWVIYLGATICVIISWIITHSPEKRRIIFPISAVSGMAIFVYFINSIGPGALKIGSAHPFAHLLGHLFEAVQYVLVLFANSLIDVNNLNKFESGYTIIIALGFLFLLAYLFSFFVFYKTRMWEKTHVPLFILVYLLLLIMALLLNRFTSFGVSNAFSPRYGTSLQLGMIGVVWIYIFALFKVQMPVWRKKVLWTLITATLLLPYIHHDILRWRSVPYVVKATEIMKETALNEDFDQSSRVCPNPALCRQGIVTLKQHNLNIFR